jgi:hypothetical protein
VALSAEDGTSGHAKEWTGNGYRVRMVFADQTGRHSETAWSHAPTPLDRLGAWAGL